MTALLGRIALNRAGVSGFGIWGSSGTASAGAETASVRMAPTTTAVPTGRCAATEQRRAQTPTPFMICSHQGPSSTELAGSFAGRRLPMMEYPGYKLWTIRTKTEVKYQPV